MNVNEDLKFLKVRSWRQSSPRNIRRLKPSADAGLKILCRDHYGVEGNVYDRPFSSRFDEQDAFMIFDEVEVAVGINANKQPLFSAEQRCRLILESTKHLQRVSAHVFEGLIVDYARMLLIFR